jgi:hypothetical protein
VVFAEQASSAEGFNPAPAFIVGVIVLAVVLTWFVRPARAAASRLVARKGNR